MAKNRLDFRAQLSRHAHDMSAGYTASIAPGMIIPQWFDIAQPGDTYYLQSAMKARLQNIIRAFYGEIDLHLDYFFVPLQMLYTPFGQVFAQTDDFISSFINPQSVADGDLGKFPTMDIRDCILASGDDMSVVDFHGEAYGKSLARLIDALDGNPLVVCHDAPQGVESIDIDLCNMGSVSPWLFAAYQCIYQKYYRNPEFERLDVGSYNFDTSYVTLAFSNDAYLKLQYVQRPSDYFTNIRVSPISSGINKFKQSSSDNLENGGTIAQSIFKVESFLTTGGNSLPFSVFGQKFDSPMNQAASFAFDTVSSFADAEKTNISSYAPISASNIRALFAVDKFARIYGRADKTYDDQILAHFGIEIPHDVKHDLTHIKHYHAVLGAKPVYGTANVPMFDGGQQNDIISTIGEVGGQGEVTLRSDDEKFTAPVHGVIMAVAYVVTKPRYTNTFSKLHWLDNRLKFPIPEFDKLGAQPIYLAEAHPWYIGPSSVGTDIRCGWQNRYAQFKQKYDRASLIYQNENYTRYDGQNNLFAPWVIARSPYTELSSGTDQDSHMLDASIFFETPHALDMIMATPYRGQWSNSYYKNPHLMFQTDPLLTEFYMRCKKVSWMSETGEPDL